MARSLTLALYLLTAARGAAGPVPARSARPEGRLVWFHQGTGASAMRLGQLAQEMRRSSPTVRFLLTAETDPVLEGTEFPEDTALDPLPPDKTAAAVGFLDHWRPDLAVFAGTSLPPAMISEGEKRGLTIILADVRLGEEATTRWQWRRALAAAVLSRVSRVLAQDPETAARLQAIGGRQLPIDVTGRIEETTDPLRCNEAERAEIAETLAARPVWCAMSCPESEEAAVLAAHAGALRLAHRMLLILVPAEMSRTEALAEKCAAEGWIVARRSAEEEPDPDVQVFIADDEGELGLIYRLAPVSYMGGTLTRDAAGRTPFEPAALGSAIVHGPHPGPYPEAYARLGAAKATRAVSDAEGLKLAISDLISPDKAAELAHNAWAVSSGGAEVTERIARMLLDALGAAGGKAAA